MAGFAKLFASITESSVWVLPDSTFRVWIAMLARSDADGIVEGSLPGFASLCRITLEQMQEAEEMLTSPDPFSRSPAHEGRRIERIQGGWLVLNYAEYRKQGQAKEGSRAPYYREYRRRKREEAMRAEVEEVRP